MKSKRKKNDHSSAETIANHIQKATREINSKSELKEEIEQLFYNLFELTNDGIFIIGLDGKYIFANNKGAEMLGYSVEEIIGRKATDFIISEERDDSLDKLKILKEGKILPIYERTIENKNGEQFVLEVNASLVTNQKGEVTYIQTVARDISKRKEIENKLRENEEKYRILFVEAREGIVLIEASSGKIIDANPEFQRQTGRSLKDLQKLCIWEIRPLEKQQLAKMKFSDIKKVGMGYSSELEFLKPDGNLTPIEFLTKAVAISNKQYLLSISRDVTEKKLAGTILEQQRKILQRQRDELDSFASTVAHDIRGKLQVISLMNELGEKSIYSEKIAEQINETVKFLNTSLLLAKEGVIISKTIPVDLNELLNKLIPKLISINSEISYNIQEFPIIKGDYDRLYQVFENILMNVIKHSKAKTVTIGYIEDETHYIIHIKDDGLGMTKKIQEKIKRSWTTKKYTSFGLMIVKKIVEAHRGKLSFESEKNQGTTFIIKLPK